MKNNDSFWSLLHLQAVSGTVILLITIENGDVCCTYVESHTTHIAVVICHHFFIDWPSITTFAE